MDKKSKIFLTALLIIFLDLSYSVTVVAWGYKRFFRLGPISSYIEDATCMVAGGKMSEFYYDCRTERKCFPSYKDGGKPCQNSDDCQGKCVISDTDIAHYCNGSNSSTSDLFYHTYCPGLTGKCETHYDQKNYDYNNGAMEEDSSMFCSL